MCKAPALASSSSIAELGPSPYARRRKALALRISWDVFQGLCVAASSLYLLAKQRSTYSPVDDSLHARAHAVWREAAADPLEALSACFTNFFMISMCGNSPVAWFAAMSFATIDDASFTTWRDGVFARFGNPYVATDGNFVPSAYILIRCLLLHGALPNLRVHAAAPRALVARRRAAAPYKIQPKKSVDKSRLPALCSTR